jgi:hypothetical protein
MPIIGIANGYHWHIIFLSIFNHFLVVWSASGDSEFRLRKDNCSPPDRFTPNGQTRHQITDGLTSGLLFRPTMAPRGTRAERKLTQPGAINSQAFNQELEVKASGAGEGRLRRAVKPRKM